jgi:hypothetical protein
MHWIQWKLATRTVALPAHLLNLSDGDLTLDTEDGRTLRWWHHDPERLTTCVDVHDGRVLLHPEFHAMSIGNAWFNCASSPVRSVCRPKDGHR